ncbi:MAG: transcription antitermination factor NusB [Xanthomonadales bacterium]|nr:transcription antitermination factor NusB [Xanthomonadales bacterium]
MTAKTVTGYEARSRARRRALQALYQWRLNTRAMAEIIAEFLEEQDFSNVDSEFFSDLCNGVIDRQKDLDEQLQIHIDRPIGRLDVMERVILQIGLLELVTFPQTPARVIIDECVDLAHRFGADQGHAFINGVLDKVARTLRKSEALPGNSSAN